MKDIKFITKDSKNIKLESLNAQLLDCLYINDEVLNVSITIENNQKYISKLIKYFEHCNILIDDLTYECSLKTIETAKIADFLIQLDFVFDCKIFGSKKTINITEKEMLININCPKDVEIILTFKNISSEKLKNISINEWKILELNPNETLVIDGIKKTVSNYKNTDFYSFPKLSSGKNTISVVGDLKKFTLTISYRERW